MLPIDEQELPGFEALLAEAKEKINKLYPPWTNYNPADSGMALLELFVYMTELQQFHTEQMGPSHILAFLHLLGISLNGLQPARTYAGKFGGKKPFYLLAGTKAAAGTLVWEVEKTVYMEPEAIFSAGAKSPFYPFGENPGAFNVYELCLNQELNMNYVHTLYFDVADPYPVRRNPVDARSFLPLVKLHLEYYDGNGYQDCVIVEDGTFGLLQEGFVQFRLNSRMQPQNGSYVLRLCAEGEYDTAPLLNGISFHMVPLVQKDTRIETREYLISYDGQGDYKVLLDFWNGVYGETRAYRQDGEGFRKLNRCSSYLSEGTRHFVLEEAELFGKEDGNAAEEARTVRLVSVQQGQDPSRFAFAADGSPGQEFFLPDENILGSGFSIWVEEEADYYVPWQRVQDFAAAGKEERCYVLEEEKGILKFGDGWHGKAPEGRIEVTGYALCAGLSGNMQKNQMLEFIYGTGQPYSGTPASADGQPYPGAPASADGQPYPGAPASAGVQPYPGVPASAGVQPYLSNPVPGTGGKNPETVKECIERYKEQNRMQERAVTLEDYEQLIRRTPGLRIKKARVFPSDRQDNCFEAVVQPYTNAERTMKTDLYQKNIMRFLEDKRMLGTGIRIRKAQFAAITLQLEVLVKSRFPEAEETIKEKIRNYFDTYMDFGKTIIYSKLYGYVDSMPQTAGIRELSLHAGGKGIIKWENGDISLPPYGIARLEELKLQCLLENK